MRLVLILLATLLLVSCNTDKSEFDPKAMELNNNAVELYTHTSPWELKRNPVLLDSILALYDSSAQLDSTFFMAYANKATLLQSIGRYKDAIDELAKATRVRKNFAEGSMGQGLLYEKLDMMDKANIKYKEAMISYKARLQNPPEGMDSVGIKCDIATLLWFIESQQKALQTLDSLDSQYPQNDKIIFIRSLIDSLTREEFIEQL